MGIYILDLIYIGQTAEPFPPGSKSNCFDFIHTLFERNLFISHSLIFKWPSLLITIYHILTNWHMSTFSSAQILKFLRCSAGRSWTLHKYWCRTHIISEMEGRSSSLFFKKWLVMTFSRSCTTFLSWFGKKALLQQL